MTPFALLILMILLAVLTFVYFIRAGQKEAEVIGEKAANMLRMLDDQYEAYMSQKMLMAGKDEALELHPEAIMDEAMIILKPNIDGLMAHINANKNYSSVNVDYYSRYFKNAVPTVEAYFQKSYLTKGQLLTEYDEKKFFSAFEDAIKSDLKQRMLELKSGK